MEPEETPEEFTVTLPACPYPGLRPFYGHEWPIFFGRERMADEVVARLIRDQFVVVHGDSGCGKSSLVRAGVLPRLEQESARGGLSWRTTIAQPRNDPLQFLAEALAALDDRAGDDTRILELRRVLNYGAEAPSVLAQALRRGPTDHICVLIDQFEELFAFARRSNSADARLYVEILVALLDSPPPGLYVVVTMRSEFLGFCAHFPGLAEAVNRAQYLLPRMNHADLMRAVREVAELYNGSISPDLAERLIIDSGGGQDQLPLIQHGLMRLSREKRANAIVGTGEPDSWRLALGDYLSIGDLSENLSNHADDVLASVEDPPFRIAEKIFRALTEINADGQAVRRPQTVRQLAAISDTDTATVIRILDAFRADGVSFVTPFSPAPIGADTLIDISHEALIRCWSRIAAPAGWLTREFQDGLLWRSLLVQADDFASEPEHLLALATAEDQAAWMQDHNAHWAERYGGGWDRVERLIGISLNTGRAARRERAAAARRRQQLTVAFGAFLVVVAVGLALLNSRANFALAQANEASAASLWNRLDFVNADRLLDDELNALWEVRMADDAVRQPFFEQLTTMPDRIARLSRRPQPVLQALSAQWTTERANALRDAVFRDASAAERDVLIALAPAVQATAHDMTAAQAQQMFARYLAVVEAAEVADMPGAVAGAMSALARRLEPPAAGDAFGTILRALASPPVTDYVFTLGTAGAALAERLSPEQTDRAFTSTLTAISTTSDPNVIVGLTPTALALAKQIDEGRTGLELIRVLSALDKARSTPEESALATVARDMAGRTTPQQATTAFKIAVDSGLALNDDPEIGLVVGGLAARAAADTLLAIGRPLVTALSNRTPSERTGNLAAVVNLLRPRMPRDEQRRINDLLLQKLAQATDALDANVLGRAIGNSTPEIEPLSQAQVQRVVPALIAAAHYGNDYIAVDGFASASARVVPQLTPVEAKRELTTVLAQMTTAASSGKLQALTALLPALSSRLTPADAASFLPQVWRMIVGTTDINRLAAFSAIVPNLARQMDRQAASRSFGVCVGFLAAARDQDQIGALAIAARALGDIADNVDPALLSPMQKSMSDGDADLVARLAPIVPLMATTLSAADADALFPRLINAMENTVYAPQLESLQRAAQAVLPKASLEQLLPFATLAAKALSGATDPDRITALTATIGALGAQLAPTARNLPQTLVAWAATPDRARAALLQFVNTPAAGETIEARVRALVGVLQYPTVTGENVTIVLDALKRTDAEAPGAAGGLAATLTWVAKKYPSALDARVTCPAPLLPSLSCPAVARSAFFDQSGESQWRVLRRFDANELF